MPGKKNLQKFPTFFVEKWWNLRRKKNTGTPETKVENFKKPTENHI
jgi:hypothetical protein